MEKVLCTVLSSGTFQITGSSTAREAILSTTGSGDIDAKKLSVQNASVEILSSGNISIGAEQLLQVKRATGSGDLSYRGKAKVELLNSSKIRHIK